MSCGRSLAWLFGVEMAPGTMQQSCRKPTRVTSPRISFLFFYFAFSRFGSRWVFRLEILSADKGSTLAVFGASQTRLL